MPLTHICISDLHCGAENSLLTPTDGQFSQPTRLGKAVGAALAKVVEKCCTETPPNLVILGDAVDLSFSSPQRANSVLVGFLKSLFQTEDSTDTDIYDRIIFVPGNHDHLLWTAERFSKTEGSVTSFSFWSHTTPAFKPPKDVGTSNVLGDVMKLVGLETPVHVYYPNFGLANEDKSRVVLFHHGHYFEDIYLAMSHLTSAISGNPGYPDTLEKMEQSNGTWIDFLWSSFGDTGQMGKDVTLAYQFLLSGGASAYFQRRVAALMTTTILSKLPLPGVGPIHDTLNSLNTSLVDMVAGQFGQLARFSFQHSLPAETELGLKKYMAGPVMAQLQQEGFHSPADDTTLIFGHTHKPFEDRIPVDGYPKALGVANTGGWVLDTTLLATVEGASAVLVDDDLNVAVIKLFAPPANDEAIGVEVTGTDGPETDNPLVVSVKEVISQDQPLWDEVKEAAAAAYKTKQAHVMKLLDEADKEARRKETLL